MSIEYVKAVGAQISNKERTFCKKMAILVFIARNRAGERGLYISLSLKKWWKQILV
jgi:hypothetical protein